MGNIEFISDNINYFVIVLKTVLVQESEDEFSIAMTGVIPFLSEYSARKYISELKEMNLQGAIIKFCKNMTENELLILDEYVKVK